MQFVKVSGGMQGGSHPPAFKRAEKMRLEEAKKKEAGEKGLVLWEGNDDPTAIKTYQRGRRRSQGTGGEIVSAEGLCISPLAAISPPSQRRIRLKDMARGGVEGFEVKQDAQDRKGDTTEDINDIATDIAALIDVAVPVLEKKQLDIRADLTGAGESSCVTGGTDDEADDPRKIDGGIQEALPQYGEADDIVEEDNETLSDIDDDEVLILLWTLAILNEIRHPQYVKTSSCSIHLAWLDSAFCPILEV